METRHINMVLFLLFAGLLALVVSHRAKITATGVVLDGVQNADDKIVGNSNVLGTQSIGPAFLNSNRSYMYQPSLVIPTPATLPNVACGTC